MSDPELGRAVSAYYAREGLLDDILAGLSAAGKAADTFSPDALTPVDQLHIGSKAATLALIKLAELRPGLEVLDVGGGLGGAARTLAAEAGCRVTVLDLTEEFCRVGEALTGRTRLTGHVTFRQGDATAAPFRDASFDVVWHQHFAMNVQDKERLYAEARRLLRPGGKLAMHEIMAGPAQPIHYPVPWARDPSINFLLPASEIRDLLKRAGFKEVAWADVSDESLQWFQERSSAVQPDRLPPLGPHLIFGLNPDTASMPGNVMRNLKEGRIGVVQAVFQIA